VIYLPVNFDLFDQPWTIRAAHLHELPTDLGLCKADELEVVINPGQCESSMRQTIWHEIVHSWEIKLELDLTERQTDLIALSLIHFFRQNPHMVEYLLDEVND
jgi:hypothetical protein